MFYPETFCLIFRNLHHGQLYIKKKKKKKKSKNQRQRKYIFQISLFNMYTRFRKKLKLFCCDFNK